MMMKRAVLYLAVSVVLLTLTGSAFGTTYYVATNGSDSNPGSSSQPWATLQKAVDTINPGDTALVRSGTYVGCKITRSGQAGAVCTLAKEPGASVIINAPGPSNGHTSVIELENYATATPVSYWVLDGFTVAVPSGSRSGFDVRGASDPDPSFAEYITIRNSVVYGSTRTGIFFGFVAYNTVENCESYNNGEHGIYQSNSGDYYTGRRNLIHNNASCGQHMNGDESMGLDGLIQYAVVEQCAMWGDGAGAAINCDGVSDSIFRNNLAYNEGGAGITLFQCDGAEASSRNKIYNNTFYFPSGGRNVIYGCNGTGNQVYNNILYTGSKCSICVRAPSELSVCDYNVVVDRFSKDDGSSTITLAAWQSQTGFDTHSFLSTPEALFVNPSGNDFHLKSGSPAINAGKTLSEVTNDRDGNSRPQGSAYDIGAYEYVSGAPQPPVANFSGNPTSGYIPLTVAFTDTSTNSPTSWSWTFGDGGTSTSQSPSHQYTTAGSYTVTLTATNAAGSDGETKTNYITANALPSPPVANFSGTPTSGTAPLTVAFTDTSTNTPTSWSWTFGDGGTSTVKNPSHQYTAAGTYTVSLTATNAGGSDGETKTNYITVSQPAPVANFTGSPTSGTAPLTVAFTDSSTNTPTSWSWTFGDSGTSTSQNPSHQYTSAGTYTVALTATNAGGSDGETKTNYITVQAAGTSPTFVAAGTVTSGTGAITPALPSGIAANDILLLFLETANQAISISNQNGGTWTAVASSPQGTGTAGGSSATRLTAFWSRYNGTQGAPTTSDSGNHQLGRIVAIRGVATSGDPWNVTAGGVESTADTSGAIPGATTTVANTLVVAAIATSLPDSTSTTRFSAWANSNLTSVTERTDNSVTAGNGGGLGVATGGKATAGAYGNTTVTLATAAAKGMMSIALKPPAGGGAAPVANFSGTPTSGTAPLTVTFTDTSTNTPTSWSWTFGDSGTSTAQNPSHQYTAAGTYTVALTATNAYGNNTNTKTNYITVTAGGATPVANFSGSPTSGTAPLTVAFTDSSTNSPTSWSWTFGDSGTSTSQNPSHQYTAAGTYTVSLTATNAYGSDGETKTNYITVTAGGTEVTIFSDHFNPWNGWTGNAMNCICASSGVHWAAMDSDEGLQRTISTSGYSSIKAHFQLQLSTGLVPSAYVQALWYDGSTWTELKRITTGDSDADGNFHTYDYNLPSGANNNPNFAFKSYTLGVLGDSGSAHSRLDDVVVKGTP